MKEILSIVSKGALKGGVGTVLESLEKGVNVQVDMNIDRLETEYDPSSLMGLPSLLQKSDGRNHIMRSCDETTETLNRYNIIHVHGVPHYGILEAIHRVKGNKIGIVNTVHSSVKREFLTQIERARIHDKNDERALEWLRGQNILEMPGLFSETFWGAAICQQTQIMSLADVVQHMNEAYMAEIVTQYHAEEVVDKHIVLTHGVPETSHYTPRSHSKNILYIGRFASEKGLDVLIESLPEVLVKHPDATIRLVGGSDDENTKYKQLLVDYLQKYAEDNDIDIADTRKLVANVQFPGWKKKEEKEREYVWADFVVIPSKSESFCLVAAEAIMRGRIPLITSTPALYSLFIKDGYAIGLDSTPNPKCIANKLDYVLHEDSTLDGRTRLDAIASRSMIGARTKYTEDIMVENQIEVYNNLLNS